MDKTEILIDELVTLKVREELAKYQNPTKRISDGWLKLRHEINTYISEEMCHRTHMSHSTCLNAIYSPIKIILGISRIDEMTSEEAAIARDVFNYLRHMTKVYNQKNAS